MPCSFKPSLASAWISASPGEHTSLRTSEFNVTNANPLQTALTASHPSFKLRIETFCRVVSDHPIYTTHILEQVPHILFGRFSVESAYEQDCVLLVASLRLYRRIRNTDCQSESAVWVRFVAIQDKSGFCDCLAQSDGASIGETYR